MINVSIISLLLLIFSTFAQAQNSFSSIYDIQNVAGVSLGKRAVLGGVVIPSSSVNLSAQVGGDVLSVNGKEGDTFKKGATLIVLEQESIRAQKDSINAEIASAAEAFKNSQVQYEQSIVSPYASDMFGGAFSMFTEPMSRFGGNNNPNFNKYANRTSRYTNVQQAKNKLKQAQSKLKQVEERLKDANVIAPFDGVIVVKNINKGDVVQSGQTLIKFANIQNLQVEVNVPSRLLHSLRLNQKYRIKLDIINRVVESVLTQIYPIADNAKHSVKVKFDLPPNIPVLSGAYAEVEILSMDSSAKSPVIPEQAIIWRSSLPSVFVVNVHNKTELRFVRLGESVGNDKKSVLSGLKIGERIILNPNVMLESGMSI